MDEKNIPMDCVVIPFTCRDPNVRGVCRKIGCNPISVSRPRLMPANDGNSGLVERREYLYLTGVKGMEIELRWRISQEADGLHPLLFPAKEAAGLFLMEECGFAEKDFEGLQYHRQTGSISPYEIDQACQQTSWLKLFVWRLDHLDCGGLSGILCALARTAEEAREEIIRELIVSIEEYRSLRKQYPHVYPGADTVKEFFEGYICDEEVIQALYACPEVYEAPKGLYEYYRGDDY